jgi:pimeloyl-ACP methyl ester carboxylesterase
MSANPPPQALETAAPPRPPAWEERGASRLFRALSPRLPHPPRAESPAAFAPSEELRVERAFGFSAARSRALGLFAARPRALGILAARPRGGGTLAATWYEAPAPARGAVLLVHPWNKWGRAYFHRGGRIEALRAAGYHAMTLDLGGFGGSAPAAGFYDRDVAAGLAFLRQRAGELPVHLWGLSSGGYWAHPALGGAPCVQGAMFEDASPHLIEWSWRMAPRLAPAYLAFRHAFPRAYRFLDLRRHAAALRLAAVAYVSGACDPGIHPEETRDLAGRAGGRCLIVGGAGHLRACAEARDDVLALALDTFRRAEAA